MSVENKIDKYLNENPLLYRRKEKGMGKKKVIQDDEYTQLKAMGMSDNAIKQILDMNKSQKKSFLSKLKSTLGV